MTVFLIPNLKKENAVPTALRAAKTLRSDAVREYFVGMGQEFAEDAKAFELCDVIVTVGGDGTILHAARQSLGYNKPLLGINIGRMGFLATVEAYEMEKLERLVHGEYILDRRSILSVSVDGQNRFRQTALNDVVISKSGISQTVDVEIFCDDILVNHYQGDGVVIATPTGSTAYSLSAGGPVLDAHIAGLVVTPICAHSLHSPSMVFSAGRRLRVSLSSPLGPHNALLSCDGRSPETISCQDTVDVALSDKYISLICFNEVTQATVSRDIRELGLVKVATGDGHYRYVAASGAGKSAHSPSRFETIFRESVLKADFAGHFVLVKCYTGMANAACEVFDAMVWNDVVGTLSGDDTFLVLMRSEDAARTLVGELAKYIAH